MRERGEKGYRREKERRKGKGREMRGIQKQERER